MEPEKTLAYSNARRVGEYSPVVLRLLLPVPIRPPSIRVTAITSLRTRGAFLHLLIMVSWR
jgi:hypothetical protein